MKIFSLLPIYILLILAGCRPSRYITEKHIKNNIEKHEVGRQSSIKTYNIFRGNTNTTGRYLELTGYKINNEKGLVIGADRSYVTRKISNPNGGSVETVIYIDFIDLNFDQVKSILTNYTQLQQKIKKEKPRPNEETYHDYTVSDDCFISFRKTGNGSSSGTEYINIWVKGEKYPLLTSQFIKKLQKFTEY